MMISRDSFSEQELKRLDMCPLGLFEDRVHLACKRDLLRFFAWTNFKGSVFPDYTRKLRQATARERLNVKAGAEEYLRVIYC